MFVFLPQSNDMRPPLTRLAEWVSGQWNKPFRKVMEKGRMGITTSPTLLDQLRNTDDHAAWQRFFDLYSPLIIGFSRRRGCSLHQAHDVLQETMVCLMKVLPNFQYDRARGQFRSFLFRIVAARIMDAYRRNRRYCLTVDAPRTAGDAGGAHRPVADPAHNPDTAPDLWNRMWDYNLLVNALDKVRRRVNTRTFRSFEMYVLQEMSASEVADRLGIAPNTVHQHRNRIIHMLRGELRKLKTQVGEA